MQVTFTGGIAATANNEHFGNLEMSRFHETQIKMIVILKIHSKNMSHTKG